MNESRDGMNHQSFRLLGAIARRTQILSKICRAARAAAAGARGREVRDHDVIVP